MQLLTQQVSAKAKILPNKVGALFMKMGTGKTRVAVELVNSVEDVDLVVWIAPLRTIKPKDELIQPISVEIEKWGGFNCKNVVYIGVETIQGSDREYLRLFRKIETAWRCFIVVDESIKIKNFEAKRTQRLLELGKMVEHKLILNGEPIVKDLLDMYAQIQFLSPKILNMSLAEFKNTFCCYTKITKTSPGYGRTYVKEYITGYENVDYLYSLIGEYIFECDLELNVKQLYETKFYKLDDEAKEKYQLLKTKYLDNEMLLMKNNNIFLELTMKMQHEYCITEEKFEQVDEWLKDKKQSKLIIYCKYIASREACTKRYPEAIVLNYKSGAFSYNLQDRPLMIFFDGTFDWGDVSQGSKRNYRTGQEDDCYYLRLMGDVNLEDLMQANNQKKENTANYFKQLTNKNELEPTI